VPRSRLQRSPHIPICSTSGANDLHRDRLTRLSDLVLRDNVSQLRRVVSPPSPDRMRMVRRFMWV
jgi:hypothetical protein